MSKLIIDGNAVYELDEDCMKKKQLKKSSTIKDTKKPDENKTKKKR